MWSEPFVFKRLNTFFIISAFMVSGGTESKQSAICCFTFSRCLTYNRLRGLKMDECSTATQTDNLSEKIENEKPSSSRYQSSQHHKVARETTKASWWYAFTHHSWGLALLGISHISLENHSKWLRHQCWTDVCWNDSSLFIKPVLSKVKWCGGAQDSETLMSTYSCCHQIQSTSEHVCLYFPV